MEKFIIKSEDLINGQEEKIGEILLRERVLTRDLLIKAIEIQKEKSKSWEACLLWNILIEDFWVDLALIELHFAKHILIPRISRKIISTIENEKYIKLTLEKIWADIKRRIFEELFIMNISYERNIKNSKLKVIISGESEKTEILKQQLWNNISWFMDIWFSYVDKSLLVEDIGFSYKIWGDLCINRSQRDIMTDLKSFILSILGTFKN